MTCMLKAWGLAAALCTAILMGGCAQQAEVLTGAHPDSSAQETVETDGSGSASLSEADAATESSEANGFEAGHAPSSDSTLEEGGAAEGGEGDAAEGEGGAAAPSPDQKLQNAMQNCMAYTGAALGGWWRAEGDDERFYLFEGTMEPRFRIFERDDSAEYGFSLAGEGALESMDPVLEGGVTNPFGSQGETVLTMSDGTRLDWGKEDAGLLVRRDDGAQNGLFPNELARTEDVPVELKTFVARSDYSKSYRDVYRYSPDEIADMSVADGAQIVSGTVRITTLHERLEETDGRTYERDPSEEEEEFAILELDEPTFMEGWQTSLLHDIKPVGYLGLLDEEHDWASLAGQHLSVAVNWQDVSFPGGVTGYDAAAEVVRL